MHKGIYEKNYGNFNNSNNTRYNYSGKYSKNLQ